MKAKHLRAILSCIRLVPLSIAVGFMKYASARAAPPEE